MLKPKIKNDFKDFLVKSSISFLTKFLLFIHLNLALTHCKLRSIKNKSNL